jgi:hypothetical protein
MKNKIKTLKIITALVSVRRAIERDLSRPRSLLNDVRVFVWQIHLHRLQHELRKVCNE